MLLQIAIEKQSFWKDAELLPLQALGHQQFPKKELDNFEIINFYLKILPAKVLIIVSPRKFSCHILAF